MISMPTGRTGKPMTLAHATQPTPRAILAGVRRIDLGDHHTHLLRLVGGRLPDQLALPDCQTAAGGLPSYRALLGLGDGQRLKDQDGVAGSEGDELLCRL